ncbi:MAG: hypothetical protein V2I33_24355 [Kangiellaceae bacterium]|jgi:SdpC family antimicrobial peptide|nr:hypothetical protein [Kangiellaceae bacterium]
MKTIRRFAKSSSFFLTSLILFLTSCHKNHNDYDSSANNTASGSINSRSSGQSSLAQFTGEQLFKGIFFFEGEVAELIPNLSNLKLENFVSNEDELNGARATYNAIMDEIVLKHPNFYNNFKTVVLSKNHVQIRQELIFASNLIQTEIAVLQNLQEARQFANEVKSNTNMSLSSVEQSGNSAQLRNEINDEILNHDIPNEETIAGIVGVVVVALAGVAVVAVAGAYIIVYNEIGLWDTHAVSNNGGGNPLSSDLFLDEVVQQLVDL